MGLPVAVMIAGNDSLIMRHQVQANADYFAVQPIVLPGVAHDLMLVRSVTTSMALHSLQCKRLAMCAKHATMQ